MSDASSPILPPSAPESAPASAPPAGGPLTARYRPQRFADVVGQEMVTSILSRASLENRIAPAYLFSGTRGVGKTTCARIFAKAMNCLTGPTAEPCNQCTHCRQITQGSSVDVVEMDGASNRGIDDARRLREDVAYAPMACRYKVCIIDEAHMLTREAFNALLKTLEEPPGNVAFILATTEAHKFPATIISRCQHFIFKRVTHARLAQHLQSVLAREGVDYEDGAVQLLARRAAGSVRDGMSLLSQVLALGHQGRGRVEEALVRDLLGLAGQDVLQDMLAAIHRQDPVALAGLLRAVLDQGLDMGFFLRELGQSWRNLFLLKQSGEAALPLLEMSTEAARGWLEWSRKFSLAHIHAAWQMTLEGQRRVLTSAEPALALELLLLNLAFLPRLLPVASLRREDVPAAPPFSAPPAAPSPAPSSAAPPAAAPSTPVSPPPSSIPPWEGAAPAPQPAAPSRSWSGFMECYKAALAGTGMASRLHGVSPVLEGNRLMIPCASEFFHAQLTDPPHFALFSRCLADYFGPGLELVVEPPAPVETQQEMEAKVLQHPVVQAVQAELAGRIINVKRQQ
ncbi:DNA polymerase III subunit gamma/tau [Megalodesulfovibrio gigas]|uniref:DNA polymerase III subunit gamma/tau n=1 Tax=Megalodesulfovibrio gigas (strain ATCC 19364 / DSM 1382 / NCIMB 9332 / VKM B-1759) TaxID=1121448 RepID=T2G793_MEGG1|nr:DNA polymerase III subunit gamma/tau [Megalodesulfovibrio gigas]AGW12138.1 putative DNA polymerase III subunits gamma and tau [Megalodesulfovibrio gigas DSM 1382 = ATCC 19364]